MNDRTDLETRDLPAEKAPGDTPPLVTHHADTRRFEIHVGDGEPAFLSYTGEGDRVVFEHTYVPDHLRGKGMGGILVRAALEAARQRQWKIIPRCTYVAAFIKRNPQFADLVVSADPI